jgi:hypothetical protein
MIDALRAPGCLLGGRVGLQLVAGLALLSFFLLVMFPLAPDSSARRSDAPVASAAAASTAAAGLLHVVKRN